MDSSKSIIWAAIQGIVSGECLEPECANPAGKPDISIPKNRVTYKNVTDKHEYPEVALPVSGRPCMQIDEKWHVLLPGRFAVITPGVEHVEGCASANESYTLLWFILAKSTMIAFACRYTLEKGWYMPMNCSLNSPRVNIMRHLIQSGGQDFTKERAENIRINILAVLTELYMKVIQESESQKPIFHKEKYADVLESLHEFIDTHYADPLNVNYLARVVGVSTRYLNSLFKERFGIGVQEQIIATRMQAANEMLKTGKFMVKQVAAKCGYDDPLYFSKAFKAYFGYSPSTI